MMLVRYDNTGSDDSQLKAIAQIKTLLGKNQFCSGLTVVVDDTREIAETQAPLYIAVAVILALIVMSVLMESWFQPLIILFSLGLAVIYNMGTNIFLGQISFITQCVAAVCSLASRWIILFSSLTAMPRKSSAFLRARTPWLRLSRCRSRRLWEAL